MKRSRTPLPQRVTEVGTQVKLIHNNVGFQIWVVPVLLAVPLTWVTNEALTGSGYRAAVYALVMIGVAIGFGAIAWGANRWLDKRTQGESDSETPSTPPRMFAGGDPPDSDTVDCLITWASKRQPHEIDEKVIDPSNTISKLVSGFGDWGGLQPSHLILLVSPEVAELDPDLGDLRPNTVVSRDVPVGADLESFHVVGAPSLDQPRSDDLLRACDLAISTAVELSSGDEGLVVADVTGASAPASIALYESATAHSVRATWWRFDPSDVETQYMVSLATT